MVAAGTAAVVAVQHPTGVPIEEARPGERTSRDPTSLWPPWPPSSGRVAAGCGCTPSLKQARGEAGRWWVKGSATQAAASATAPHVGARLSAG